MKKIIFSMLAFAALLISSCSQDVFEAPAEEAFSKSFAEVFGKIDPNEDWNAFATRSVTVEGNGEDVKVYTFNGDIWKLADSYDGFTGSKTISVDAPENCNRLLVSCGGQTRIVEDGGHVAFRSTRAISSNNVKDVFEKLVDANGNPVYKEFTIAEVNEFQSIVPEGNNNTNKSNLVKNFSATKEGNTKVCIYPVYWNGTRIHEFGVYTYNEDGTRNPGHIIFKDHQGDDMCQYSTQTSGNNWTNYKTGIESKDLGTSVTAVSPIGDGAQRVRSQGVELTIQENTKFGFYIVATVTACNWRQGIHETSEKYTYYSEAALNDSGNSYASFFRATVENAQGKTIQFLGFEDKSFDDGSDKDLNDLVVVIDTQKVDGGGNGSGLDIIVEEEENTVRFACEDLGNTDDFDFNDVVFDVNYTRHNGETIAMSVTPLAAGGQYDAEIWFKDEKVGEIHDLLGGPRNAFINTQSFTKTAESVAIKNVDKNFTASASNLANNGSIKGFRIVVPSNNKQIVMPGRGEAPMMMCIPEGWAWPTEKTRISDAYPGFGRNAEYFPNDEWYNQTPTSGTTINK